jgi:hypothetical protein
VTLAVLAVVACGPAADAPRAGDVRVDSVGMRLVTVPAGTFDTVHYRIAGRSDVWIHGEDRMMIRMRMPGAGLEYVLSRLETGP